MPAHPRPLNREESNNQNRKKSGLKGQQQLAQGNALGVKQNGNVALKGQKH